MTMFTARLLLWGLLVSFGTDFAIGTLPDTSGLPQIVSDIAPTIDANGSWL